MEEVKEAIEQIVMIGAPIISITVGKDAFMELANSAYPNTFINGSGACAGESLMYLGITVISG